MVMVNSKIIEGHRFVDHPSMTDWMHLCHSARKVLGAGGVVVDRGSIALHADLGSGKYENESWH
jgi:hypothetical protein